VPCAGLLSVDEFHFQFGGDVCGNHVLNGEQEIGWISEADRKLIMGDATCEWIGWQR